MEQQKNKFLLWLERLQQESWQLELLISGFLLSMLIGAQEAFHTFSHTIPLSPKNGMAERLVVSVFLSVEVSLYVLILNLILHIFLRSLWIASIGLRNISGDLDINNLKLSPSFLAYFERKLINYDAYIEQLERICCMIFAYTFLIVFSVLSLFLSLFVTTVFAELLKKTTELFFFKTITSYIAFLLFFLFVVSGLLYMIDFISLGAVKRIRWFSRFYLPAYRFWSTVSLAWLYRPLYYNMLDNSLGRKVLWSIIPYLLILSLLNSFDYNDLPYFPQSESPHLLNTHNYEAESENNDRYDQKGIILDKQVYEPEDFAKVFYLLYDLNRDIGYKSCIYESNREETGFIWNKTTHVVEVKYETNVDVQQKYQKAKIEFTAQATKDSAMLHCIATQLLVRIDDSLQVATEFDFYKHPKINRKGIMATLDLKEIPRGKHYVSYSVKDSTDIVVQHYKVAFWKK